MTIGEISTVEFESIVDKYKIHEVSIDVHTVSEADTHFPKVDIGIKTHCESRERKIIIQRFSNGTNEPISDKIELVYDPVISIYRDCLFVKPDDVNQKRLDSILNNSDRIKFFFYDVTDPKSMISTFKDSELRDEIQPYENPTIDYDVVILFYAQEVRNHLKQIANTYKSPYSGMEPNTINSRKRKIVDKYISGFNYGHLLLIVILAGLLLSFSMAFGVDDIDPNNPRNIPPSNDPITNAAWESSPLISPIRMEEMS
jgi:hypothetical protein